MKYLLDTDTLIDFLENRGVTRQRIFAMISAGDEVALCAITVAELYSGLTPKRREEWGDWFAALPYWHISFHAAQQAGVVRKQAAENGQTFPVTDLLIAACAQEQGAIVLTSNRKDYPMQDVKVQSLQEEAA